MPAGAFSRAKPGAQKRVHHEGKTLSEWSESGETIDTHSPALVEANGTTRVSGSLYQHLRVVRSIYEVFEVRPCGEVAREIVIKNDPGAEMTLISPILYDWAREKDIIHDEIVASPTKVSFTAGAGAEITTMAQLPVFLPEFMLPVWIQVVRMPGMVDGINHILLGLDNSDMMGQVLHRREGQMYTMYHSIPGAPRPIKSEHQPRETIARQFTGCEFGSVEIHAEVAACAGNPWGMAPALIQDIKVEDIGSLAEAIDYEDTNDEVDEIDSAFRKMIEDKHVTSKWAAVQEIKQDIHKYYNLDKLRISYKQEYHAMEAIGDAQVQALRALVETGEKAVQSMSKAKKWIEMSPVAWQGDEIPIVDAATVPGGFDEDKPGGALSIAFKVDEKAGTVVPIDMNAKDTGDHAATGWQKWTKEEIVAQILSKAKEDGVPLTEDMLPKGFIDDLYDSSQPSSEILPAIKGHYFYVRLKKNWTPWAAKYRSVPRALLGRLKKILDKMQSMGLITPGESQTTCALSLVLKKGEDGEMTIDRVAVDARPLNAQIEKSTEQIPVADMLYQFAEGAFIYTALDLVKAFMQVPLWGPHKRLCAIATPAGTYLLQRMFFGIATSSSFCQAMVRETVGPDLYGMASVGNDANEIGDEGAVVFVDDVLCYTRKRTDESEKTCIIRHFELVARIVKRMKSRNMTVSINKSFFGRREVKYLGYILGREGMSIDKQKQLAITDAPFPKTAAEIHRLVGSAVWLQRVLRCNLSQLLSPLRKYTQMRPHDKSYVTPFNAKDPAVIRAVAALKDRVAKAVTLKPVDWSRPMHIHTDAAQSKGIGMVLSQWYDEDDLPLQDNTEQALNEQTPPPAPRGEDGNPRQGAFYPLYFASKSINPDIHGRWDAREIECYALTLALKKFESYCMGSKVILHSDSKSLEYMERYANQFGKIGRWLNYFSLYDTTFHWTRGLSMGLPDYMSRAPIEDKNMSEDGEDDNHKLNPEYLENLVFPKSTIVSVGSKSTAKKATNNSRQRTSSQDASLQKKTKIKNVKFQDENNGPATLAQSVEAEELLDVDANVQTIGATCSTRPTWLTEGGEEEVVIVSTVEAQQRFEATQQSASLCDFTKQISVESVKPNLKVDQELTMFSVCSGIGSGQMAIERAGLPIKTIGVCETDPDCAELFKEAFPDIPVYGDMRFVIAAIENKDLVLNPTILELTVPCQARSVCRTLADWSDTVHPSARLWDLQIKMVKLCKPKVVIIENVPPYRNEKRNIDTIAQFESLEKGMRELGYHCESGILRASMFGDATQRRRYIAVLTVEGLPPVKLPTGNKNLFKGFWKLLEERRNVGMKYRCMLQDGDSEFERLRTRADDSDRHMSMQVARLKPLNDKERKVANEQDTNNPKGFRVYSPSYAHCVITSYGNPTKCGPGRQTQFIMDHVGIRTLTIAEACRIHSFIKRVEELLTTRREQVAMAMIGNSIPVRMYASVFEQVVKVLSTKEHQAYLWSTPTMRKNAAREAKAQPVSPADEEDVSSDEENMTNPLTADELEEMRHFYPDDEALASAQKDDPEWNSKREQLQILLDEPKHLLNETYMKKLGIGDARLKSLSHLQMVGDVLCHVPLPRQFYQADGTAKLAIESTAPLKIVPAKLRDMIAYLHHYSALAVHASAAQMWDDIRDAGYWFPGGPKLCQKVCKSCHKCFNAHQVRSALHGIHTSRRFRASNECVSWDCSFYGKGGPTDRGNNYCLVILDEFDMWIDLIPLKTNKAVDMADALVLYILRYGMPMLLWSGKDTEIANKVCELVCEKLRIKQMFSSSRNSNGLARSERQHRVVNETLKLLVDHDTKNWDEKLPFVEHSMRNKSKDGGFSPYQLRHGKRMRVYNQITFKGDISEDEKRFPVAREYMRKLRYSLHDMWNQYEMWSVEAQCKVWAEVNKNRKDETYQIGDFVMVHQPLRVKGAASRLLANWIGPFCVEEKMSHKTYKVINIDTGRIVVQTVSNLHKAPSPLYATEYSERLTHVRKQIPPDLDDIVEDDMLLVNTERVGVVPAKVLQILDDGTLLIDWYNGPSGKFRANSAIYPVFYDREAAKKEIYTYTPTEQQSNDACWTIIKAKQIVGPSFSLVKKSGKQYLPDSAKQQLASFQKGMKKKSKK